MQVTWEMLLIVCPLAMLAGFVDSVAGGGGLISLPAYYLAGLPPVLAGGTNKLSASLGTVVASVRYGRAKQVNWLVALVGGAGAIPGAVYGSIQLKIISEGAIRIIVIVAISLVAAVVLRGKNSLSATRLLPEKYTLPVSFLTGLLIGFYDGFIGPGTGTFLILIFTRIYGMETVKSSGTAKIVNLASNVAALITLIASGHVLYLLGLPAALCAMAGGYIGSGMTLKRGAGFIKWMLITVLALLLAKMVWDMVT